MKTYTAVFFQKPRQQMEEPRGNKRCGEVAALGIDVLATVAVWHALIVASGRLARVCGESSRIAEGEKYIGCSVRFLFFAVFLWKAGGVDMSNVWRHKLFKLLVSASFKRLFCHFSISHSVWDFSVDASGTLSKNLRRSVP